MGISYTPEQLGGKYITCFPCVACVPHSLDCVRQVGGPHDGQPFLYDSIQSAQSDKFFVYGFDEVVTAQEYFKRISK